jgi:hypothetical protein
LDGLDCSVYSHIYALLRACLIKRFAVSFCNFDALAIVECESDSFDVKFIVPDCELLDQYILILNVICRQKVLERDIKW